MKKWNVRRIAAVLVAGVGLFATTAANSEQEIAAIETAAAHEYAKCLPKQSEGWSADRAVSLRQLQKTLQRCGRHCPPAAMRLYDLGRVDGLVIDEKNRDLVIFGPARKAKAPIQRTDDFIVAFRAAALRYAVVKGNTRFISDPGVTLNARPKTIARLHRLRMGGAEGAAAYCKICKDKQDLKVLGLPHNSGPAEIMAKADYVLKSVANSDLPVKGKVPKFVSLAEKRRNAVKKALAEGKFVATSSMSRLWFYPGAVTYRDRPGAIALDRADFVVRQQRQVVSADGRHRDGGRADRLTKEWTCEISKLYREIAAAVPESHFDALARLLRIFAVTKLMVDRRMAEKAGLDLSWLLDRHKVKPVKVDREWDGVAHVERVEHRVLQGSYVATHIVHMPSCGGVEFSLRRNMTPQPDTDRKAARTEHRVIASRPSAGTTMWTVR